MTDTANLIARLREDYSYRISITASRYQGDVSSLTMEAAQEIERLSQQVEALKLEAQAHAQEARTANATIADIYRVVTGSTGEPGNWNGAEPVRKRIAALESELAALANQEPLMWLSRYMGDPRQSGAWETCKNVKWAKEVYAQPNHMTDNGWEVRPVFARPVRERAEPIYQITDDGAASWSDTDWMTYDSAHSDERRIVFAHPPAAVADWQAVCAEAYNVGHEDGEAEARAPATAAAEWISVDARLPDSGKTVLATYLNRCGKPRRIRAQYVAAKTREQNFDNDELDTEYDEASDTYYWKAGWYECIDNWPDYSCVAVCEGDVTHWTLMPDAPAIAAEKERKG